MSLKLRGETWLTMLGLSVMAAVFVFAVYLPGHHRTQQLRAELAETEQQIRDVPVRLAEIETLRRDLADRQEFLSQTAHWLPPDPQIEEVVQQVTGQARLAGLAVTRLEPAEGTQFKSYQQVPFRMSFRGPYGAVHRFVARMESQMRLYTIEELHISGESEKAGGIAKGDIYFSVYAILKKSADSAEKSDSASPAPPVSPTAWHLPTKQGGGRN